MSYGKKPDIEKPRRWQRIVRDAARSGLSIREFCRQGRIKESQFYWWQRRLHDERGLGRRRSSPGPASPAARFALVSDEPGTLTGRDRTGARQWPSAAHQPRASMKRRCGRYWPAWKRSHAEFPGGDQPAN